jgi:hypothetical protein
MGVESDADRAVYVNPDEFGTAALFDGTALNGIFDSTYIDTEIGAGVPIEGARLRFLCRTADLPEDAAHGKDFEIQSGDNAGFYIVREIHPDGTGITELVLEAT